MKCAMSSFVAKLINALAWVGCWGAAFGLFCHMATPAGGALPGITPLSPSNNSSNFLAPAVLAVSVEDADGDPLTVTYYTRNLTPASGRDFTIVAMPDTQYYTGALNGGSPAILYSQIDWILTNRAARNIAYMAQLGDCVQNGDNGGNPVEWLAATNGYYRLENPLVTELPYGLPYGIAVGNHDQSPQGDAEGATTFYNQFFGAAHFAGMPYWAGHYGTNADNFYELFSASGLDFVAVYFEYDTVPDAPVLAWADQVLQAHPNRRAIVVSHWLANTGNPASFSAQGQAVYTALRTNANLFLMLSGHVPGEGRRQDVFEGRTVHTVVSDFQGRANGGDGWLRIMEFSPSNNVIRVSTYSPTRNQFETDADSQFTLPYIMSLGSEVFAPVGTNSGVIAGATSSFAWSNLLAGTTYEWYAVADDGLTTSTGAVWRFTTAIGPAVALTSPQPNATLIGPANITLQAGASDADGTVALVEFYVNGVKLGEDTTIPYSLPWATSVLGTYALTAVAMDNFGLSTTSVVVLVTVTTNSPPSVALTSIADGSVFFSGTNLTLTASASDLEGALSRVEFLVDGQRLRTDTASPFSQVWSSVPLGSFALTAVAVDNAGLSATSSPVNVTIIPSPSGTNTIIPGKWFWKYRDDGSDQGASWRALNFDDSAWAVGVAELGYGDGDEATVVSYGPNAVTKFITTYFRRVWTVTETLPYSTLLLKVLRDDGAVVYLNGVEVFRHNMPAGTISFTTLASTSTPDETTFFSTNLAPALLTLGTNILAVEIHQASGTSSDASFDLQLVGSVNHPPALLTHPGNVLVQAGASTTFSASATGTPPLTYQWRFEGAPIVGATNSTHAIAAVNAGMAGSYSAVVSNPYGVALSSSAVLAVNHPPVTPLFSVPRSVDSGVKFPAALLLGTDPDGDVPVLQSTGPSSTGGGTIVRLGLWVIYTPPIGSESADTFPFVLDDGRGGLASGTVTVNVVTDNVPSENMVVEDAGNGALRLRCSGIPGRAYSIQVSNSLSTPDWQTLAIRTADSLGEFECVDTVPGGLNRFYRSTQP
jgi:Bacterial Ig domain